MRWFGIDPGTIRCGWACISDRGTVIEVIASGVIKFKGSDPLSWRLHTLYSELVMALQLHHEGVLGGIGVEGQFVKKNVQSAITIGRSSGVAMAAAASFFVPVIEISPATAKAALGHGRLDKDAVRARVRLMLGLDVSEDQADAIAIAIAARSKIRAQRSNLNTE